MPRLTRTLVRCAVSAAVLAGGLAVPCRAGERPSLDSAARWACFYGSILSTAAWQSLDLAVLDPDAFVLRADSGPVRLAYVSAGEADERRWFWASVSSRPFLVEPNPDWPGAHRVDLRSEAWRSLLLDQVIPAALGKGYQGVMFDTLDTAGYLQSKDPVKFAGSLDAAVALVQGLRERRPQAFILVNNALPLLDRLGPLIDGVVVEDLYTRCHAQDQACAPTPGGVSKAKEKALQEFAARTGKPVFVILYARLQQRDDSWVRAALRRCRRNGFRPYLASPSLDRFGRVYPEVRP